MQLPSPSVFPLGISITSQWPHKNRSRISIASARPQRSSHLTKSLIMVMSAKYYSEPSMKRYLNHLRLSKRNQKSKVAVIWNLQLTKHTVINPQGIAHPNSCLPRIKPGKLVKLKWIIIVREKITWWWTYNRCKSTHCSLTGSARRLTSQSKLGFESLLDLHPIMSRNVVRRIHYIIINLSLTK